MVTASGNSSEARRELRRRRRTLIWTTWATILVAVVAAMGMFALMFSADRQAWSDESRVLHTQGTVLDEVSGSGSCKGPDFDTLIEWSQDGKTRSAWARTCASGPDVGDRVDVWVRDDGKITLTAPSTTIVFIVVGILVFVGLGALSFFALRFNLRKVNEELAAL